jgi:hypothetical protein
MAKVEGLSCQSNHDLRLFNAATLVLGNNGVP